MPNRAAPFSMSASLWGWMSQDRISPLSPMSMASAKDLPPGAAHMSSARVSGCGAAAVATNRAAASCTVKCPSVKAGRRSRSPVADTSKQPSSHGWAFTVTPAVRSSFSSSSAVHFSVLVWMVVGTISLFIRR